MLFNSLDFILFFLAVYGLYLCLPFRAQNRMLLAASYLFYGWITPWFCPPAEPVPPVADPRPSDRLTSRLPP